MTLGSVDRRGFLAVSAFAGLATAAPIAAKGASRLRPVELRVSQLRDPLGTDDREPSLSWRLEGPEGAMQGAYRLLVASSVKRLRVGHADLWDSGKVPGSACAGIAYRGKTLLSRQRCYWRVQVWDQQDKFGATSEAANWEMGLLHSSDWLGDWLAAESSRRRDDRSAAPAWIGGVAAPDNPRQFALSFSSDAEDATLTITTDGLLTALALDDVPIELPKRDPNAFGGAPAARVRLSLTPGEHRLTAQAVPNSGFVSKPTVALGAHLRLDTPEAARWVNSGWLTRLTSEQRWGPGEQPAELPTFPWPSEPARRFRRNFSVRRPVQRARLYLATLGSSHLWLNGVPVPTDALGGEPADFRAHVPYRTFDVTSMVRTGQNAIGAIVADGWYGSYLAPTGRYSFGPAPLRFRAMLFLAYSDGSEEIVATDSTWRSARSHILSSELYDGEVQDLRDASLAWTRPEYDDASWDPSWSAPSPQGPVAAAVAPPVQVMHSLSPDSIRRVGRDRHIIDFGQNFAGRLRLRIKGDAGQEVRVRHAEILDKTGELDRRNLRAARAEDRFILAGGVEETLEPRFTYQGFRYAEVTGVAELPTDAVEARVLRTAIAELGMLEISNPIVQKLWHNTLWSQRSNFIAVPTDCPQRDERLAWSGDAQVFWDTASFNMDTAAFTRNYMRHLRDAQGRTGGFPLWAPTAAGLGWGTETPTPGWADAGVMLPYVSFMHTGDRLVIDENWDAMSRYVAGILEQNPDNLWREGRGADLGDWLALDATNPFDETTPKLLIGTAMLARSLSQLVEMAQWTGRTDEAAKWRMQADAVRAAFVREFVRPDGSVGNGSHTSYVLALRLGLVPETLRAAAGQHLADDIRRRGTILSTGFLGTPLALDALVDVGYPELAYDLLLRTQFPSWGYMVARGATTIWERWNSDVGDVAMNSFNHYALGAVCGFLYRRVAGIEPVAPGFERIRFEPQLDSRLEAASARLDSRRGRIEASWRRSAKKARFDVVVPANSTGEVRLPREANVVVGVDRRRHQIDRNTFEVGPGSHSFTFHIE